MALTFGFPRMHKETGERRDFLPPLIGTLARMGCEIAVEHGIGSEMGYTDVDYLETVPSRVSIVDEGEAYRQDVVVVLRAPVDRFEWLELGATLVAMLHFPTRPARVRKLDALGVRAISLDTIEDDEGDRLVVNATAVAWNGLEAAFETLERTWPPLTSRVRRPVRVTVMGAGAIGKHAVEAATKFGNVVRAETLARYGVPGVEVVTIGRNLTSDEAYVAGRLAVTDILVDATQRYDPSQPLIRNHVLGALPPHAVICDLVVDPYLLDEDPPTVRGIEECRANLDRWVFDVDDPAWDAVPSEIPNEERRPVVSCYSWPGVHPKRCMERYGNQLTPLLETLVERQGVEGLRPDGSFHERALYRGTLDAWLGRLVVGPSSPASDVRPSEGLGTEGPSPRSAAAASP